MRVPWPGARWLGLLLLCLAMLGLSGCATSDETDNASVRPWNTPKGWETSLPGGMTEGR